MTPKGSSKRLRAGLSFAGTVVLPLDRAMALRRFLRPSMRVASPGQVASRARSFSSMLDALTHIKRAEIAAVEKRFDALLDYYAVLLSERAERDETFRRRRRHARAGRPDG